MALLQTIYTDYIIVALYPQHYLNKLYVVMEYLSDKYSAIDKAVAIKKPHYNNSVELIQQIFFKSCFQFKRYRYHVFD